jgi:hypothetical protein
VSQLVLASVVSNAFGLGCDSQSSPPPPVVASPGDGGTAGNPGVSHPIEDAAVDASVGGSLDAGLEVTLDFGINPSPGRFPDAGYVNAAVLADAEVLSLGTRAVSFSVPWNELATNTGEFAIDAPAFARWAERLSVFRRADVRVGITLDIVEGELSSELASLGVSQRLAAARRMIDAVYSALGATLAYFGIGRDLDRYLARASQAERETFTNFVRELLLYARQHADKPPQTAVGVLASCRGWSEPDPSLTELASVVDLPLVTFYPFTASFGVPSAERALVDLRSCLGVLGTRGSGRVALHEVAFPSAVQAQSSDELQGTFYELLVAELQSLKQAVSFAAIRALNDGEIANCEVEAATFGQPPSSPLVPWLCSVGVRSDEGSPKAAFGSVLRGLAAFRSR